MQPESGHGMVKDRTFIFQFFAMGFLVENASFLLAMGFRMDMFNGCRIEMFNGCSMNRQFTEVVYVKIPHMFLAFSSKCIPNRLALR